MMMRQPSEAISDSRASVVLLMRSRQNTHAAHLHHLCLGDPRAFLRSKSGLGETSADDSLNDVRMFSPVSASRTITSHTTP